MSARHYFAMRVLAGLIAGMTGISPIHAATTLRDRGTCAAHAAEASQRSGLRLDIVLRVMMAESGGNSRALSPKGAGGCMQIMPATWTYVSARYALGPDRFDPRMNMIGGALYLAELAARYGFPGAYAAYNAGPGRYERYVAGTAALPGETIAYTARIGRSAAVGPPPPLEPRWQEATLFLARSTRPIVRLEAARAATGDALRSSNALFPLMARDPGSSSETAGR